MKTTAALCIVTGLCIGFILKFFVLDILHITGSSMEPSLNDGDAVAVLKCRYGLDIPFSDKTLFQWSEPKAGDVVIFMHDNKTVIKRCVAAKGAPLDYSTDNGYTLFVMGHEYLLSKEQYDNLKDTKRVPDGTILAIGDNSRISIDSRTYGFIPVYNILGKALCR
jgi:signal peptidase I